MTSNKNSALSNKTLTSIVSQFLQARLDFVTEYVWWEVSHGKGVTCGVRMRGPTVVSLVPLNTKDGNDENAL